MTHPAASLPYFDRLLNQLANDDAPTKAAFGKHVHWGYFADPDQGHVTAVDYGEAAEAMCLQLLELAGITTGQRILDVGCGFGGTLACLNRLYSPVELIGLNIDSQQLRQAAAWIEPEPTNAVCFVAADAAALPLASGSIDRALCVESVFHFDRAGFFAEVARVLRPGGSLTLSDFLLTERAAQFVAGINLGENEAVRAAYGAIDISWTRKRYAALAADCGLFLTHAQDIGPHTLPTYAFLESCVEAWEDPREAELFRQATRRLEQATRRGFMAYQLMRFEKP